MTVLPDVLAPGLKVVFCGTAAGNTSARVGAYYAGPGNKFWDTLFRTGLTPMRLVPGQFRDVLCYGVGLTDIVKTASGPDVSLPSEAFDRDGLRRRILELNPEVLAFNGKKSAKEFFGVPRVEYGRQPVQLGGTMLFVLPSTARTAQGFWDPQHWYDLAEFLRGGSER